MPFIESKIVDNIACIRFNRPDALNAFNTQMYADFAGILDATSRDSSINAVLLSGEGKDFCAGNDIAGFVAADEIDPQTLADRKVTPSTDVVHLLAELDKPLIGCVQGRAIGFGATMLLHCDFLIAEPSATFIYPFANIGIVPEAGCTALMELCIGKLQTRKVLMLGEPVPADTAFALGLVSELVAEGEAKARGMEIAKAISSKPSEAVRATKRLLNRPPEPLGDRMTAEFVELGQRLRSDETQAIMRSFKSK